MRTRVAAAAIFYLTCLSSGRLRADNLVPNPGFEQADGADCAFWQKRTPDDAMRKLEWTADAAHSGGHGLEITNLQKTQSRWRVGHLGDVVPTAGAPAKLTAWVRTAGKDCSAWVALYVMKGKDQIAGQFPSARVAGDSHWRQVSVEAAMPADTDYAMVYLELDGCGTACYDDLILEATPGQRKANLAMATITYNADDLEIVDGLEVVDWGNRRFLQLRKDAKSGCAQRFFCGESARYDIAFTCIDEAAGNSSVRVWVNDRDAGRVRFDAPKGNAAAVKSLPGVNIQRNSRVRFEFQGDRGERCRTEKAVFTAVGRFEGEFAQLTRPDTLRIYETLDEQRHGQQMLNAFVQKQSAPKAEERKAELAALRRPQDWQARQAKTRSRLHEFFGEFPPKTPLNARVTGKLDREKYVIEKVVFESQPKYYCTANFYAPKDRPLPVPGVLFTCGHAAEGKAAPLYHECCLGLVLKGYAVLALDPTGQGERSEYFDPATRKPLVTLTVSQHHYVGRPAFLVGWSLAGLRTWDAIRAVDYLVSRPEVDKEKLAAVGNSGGGQMALLITAVDERIKVCAAAHPGGSMENTYLLGQGLIDKEVLSLIPPRPCRWIVGKDSGEEPGHRSRMEDMQLFYDGLGVGKQLTEMDIVDGVHDMKQPKRESAYEWLNKWFDKDAEGKAEAALRPENGEALQCTESGCTLVSLGGESGQTLNAKRLERIYKPEPDPANLKARVMRRLGLAVGERRDAPASRQAGAYPLEGVRVEKLCYESEPGIEAPSLLFAPKESRNDALVIVHTSDHGKPAKADAASVPILLARRGYTVLCVDVRGVGETDPSPPVALTQYTGYTPMQWRRDCLAIQSVGFGRTMLGMRALDVIRAVDLVKSRDDLREKRVVLFGEGLGGVWALVAAACDSRPEAVVCAGAAPSYKLLVNSHYYNVWGYFWTPGALCDFDIPDVARLVSPRRQLWLDSVNALAERMEGPAASAIVGSPPGLSIVATKNGAPDEAADAIVSFLQGGIGK